MNEQVIDEQLEASLHDLAGRCGLEPRYWDIWGNEHTVSGETQRALLAAMKVPVGSAAEIRQSLARCEASSWQRVLPPVQVIRVGQPLRIVLTLPEKSGPDRGTPGELSWTLVLENGERHGGQFRPADLEIVETRDMKGTAFKRRALDLPIAPGPGYHRLEIAAPDWKAPAAMSLIVAPETCYLPERLQGEGRVWGFAAQLYILRSQRNWGIGDFTDLKMLAGHAAELGAGIVALNPLHALFPHNPAHASPYSPSSRLFLNVLYLDVEAVPEYAGCEAAQEAVRAPQFQERLRTLRQAELVDYRGVAVAKLSILELVYRWFVERHLGADTERARAFHAFQREGGEALRLHAVYEALQERFFRDDPTVWGWPVWPEEYRSPASPAVARFAEERGERVEFYQYLQWLADAQLGEAGRRSLELHLAVGIYQDLAVSVDRGGAEAWANQRLYAQGASIGAPPDDFALNGQDWGLPPPVPERLTQCAYEPFIAILRQTMRHAGALRIDHVMGLMRLFWVPAGHSPAEGAYVHYPFHDLLGILALESRRNQCLVIGEDLGTVPNEVREALKPLGVLSYRLFYYERKEDNGFKPPAWYPGQALAAVTTQDLPTLAGWWQGRDLAVRRDLGLFPSQEEDARQQAVRQEDKRRMLWALQERGLLPESMGTDPDAIPAMSAELALAVHRYLAQSPAKIVLVQMEDLTGQTEQVNLPGTTEQYPNWRRKLTLNLGDLFADARVRRLAQAMHGERGSGSGQPAPPSGNGDRGGDGGGEEGGDGGEGAIRAVPGATYRLQFNGDFTFTRAAEIVPYLADLGVSHCYASPYLKARAGSTHGYDIVDHNAINPEIGSLDDYERFVQALHRRGMGQVLDIVPNHMGVGGDDNGWWLDVLENGQASVYAQFFDIDWRPVKDELRGKVLLPVLGDHYGKVLENGELVLSFDAEHGAFSVRYYHNRFPIDPRTYPVILGYRLDRLELAAGVGDPQLLAFQSLVTAFEHLPARWETSEDKVKERNRDKEVHKSRLAELYRSSSVVAQFIDGNLIACNGQKGDSGSFELLHDLLESQAYRLASWRVASDEINYRRFFDVNMLAGLRMERPEVFHATHRLILDLIAQGKLNGLRIDHPDGLYDPTQYYQRLHSSVTANAPQTAWVTAGAGGARMEPAGQARPLYIVVEKILASYEHLREDWPVDGTTGYEFASLVNGLLVYPGSQRQLDRLYSRFIGHPIHFDELVYGRKRLIMKVALSSELAVLATELNAISESDRHTRDFTLNNLRSALMEVVACFPVYRTYVTADRVTDEDRHYVDWAVADAKRRSTAADTSIFDFIHDILLLDAAQGKDPAYRERVVDFAMKFQQYTAPVMAKGLEDTAFYIYNRLISLNEVGGDPRRYSVSLEDFHHANQQRATRRPHAMLTTSTHDNKRSEDVRARIDALSELPELWRTQLARWSRINRPRKRMVDGHPAPSRNDEYLLYQTLLGAWPLQELDHEGVRRLRERIQSYMLKAVREAKIHTSWINTNTAYEDAVNHFVQSLLAGHEKSPFLDAFIPFQRRIARFGLLNSLTQTLLKLTAPGVPDIYQGNEVWDFSLVDPDNRRPVDYARRRAMLQELGELISASDGIAARVRGLLGTLDDGRAKLYLTCKSLRLRRERPELFERGDYQPLAAQGARAEHLCAFARQREGATVIAVAPRWYARLVGDPRVLPLGEQVWSDTVIQAPEGAADARYLNVLTGEWICPETRDGRAVLSAARLLASFPVALLASA